jgi:hypothetical protein
MKNNTPGSIDRPLFEEPTSDIERESPWDEPLGFMIGGMAHPSKQDLAIQYFDAANRLLESIKAYEVEDYTLINPVLFLYRHSIEMLLKAIIGERIHTHDLSKLTKKLTKVIKVRFDKDVPMWIINRLDELAQIDPEATAFRYAENFDKSVKGYVVVPGELHVNLHHLQRVMKALQEALVNLVAVP